MVHVNKGSIILGENIKDLLTKSKEGKRLTRKEFSMIFIDPRKMSSNGKIYNGDINILKSYVEKGIMDIPQFDEITGYFNCNGMNLKSLKNSPKKVRRGFFCANNKLTSLAEAPEEVGGDFDCRNNKRQFFLRDVNSHVKGTIKL